ncbi:MAG: hypothetical protein ACYTEL_07075 [Planctomycetota bacterium]|jgi:hypothetical protein
MPFRVFPQIVWFLLIVFSLSGCPARQNVRPYFDSAIANFEVAKERELVILSKYRNKQLLTNEVVFDQLEKGATEMLRHLIISGWDQVGENFKGSQAIKNRTWAAWLGITFDQEPDRRELIVQKALLRTYLAEDFTYQGKNRATGVDQKVPLKAFKIFANLGGDFTRLSVPAATEDEVDRLHSRYANWLARFDEDVLRKAPVIVALHKAKQSVVESVENETKRREQRIKALYANLIELVRIGRDQAGTLTDNSGFISLANNALSMAGRLLDRVKREEGVDESEVPNPGAGN